MMPNSPTNPTAHTGTGKAPIVKQGHTSNTRYGSEPQAKVKGGAPVRDLGVTSTKA